MAASFSGISFLVQPGPDFVVTSADGEVRLLVEVKTRNPAYMSDNEDVWPNELRREYGQYTCYFLLVTAERMLLFLPGDPAMGPLMVSKESSAVLAPYLNVERFPLRLLGELELGGVVRSWLGSVMFKPATVLLAEPAQAWLVESGLHTQIYQGYITREQKAA